MDEKPRRRSRRRAAGAPTAPTHPEPARPTLGALRTARAAAAAQRRRPRADRLLARPSACGDDGERAALQRAARRAGRLRDPPPGPHLPARPRDHCPLDPTRPGRPDRPRSRSRLSRSSCSTTASPPSRRPQGAAEVVVYTDDHDASLRRRSPPERAEALMWVWRHRYAELGAREDVEYVTSSRTAASRSASRCTTPTARSTATPSCRPCRRSSSPPTSASAAARRARCSSASARTGARHPVRERGGASPTCRRPPAGPTKRTSRCASTAPACSTASREELRLLADGAAARSCAATTRCSTGPCPT